MNNDKDGRDEPQSLQPDSQTQILINTQRELAQVKDDLGQATQTIGQLFLEKQQFQQRIRALEKQVDEFQDAKPEASRPTNSPAVDQNVLRRTRAELKSSEDERKRLVEKYEAELSELRRELQAVKEAEVPPATETPVIGETKKEKEKKLKVNNKVSRRLSARVGDLFKPKPGAEVSIPSDGRAPTSTQD